MSVKVYVLIVTAPEATKKVYETLAKAPNVTETHEVMGPYDIVAEIEVNELAEVPSILSAQVRPIEGIQSTTSLVSFPSD